jgi:steroid delta-isomerase-like uncharacterized protein
MPVEENVALIRRWFNEVWNQRKLDAIAGMMASDAIVTGMGGPEEVVHGPAEFRVFAERFQKAFSGIRITVEDAFGSGDKVAVRWSGEMTHTGDDIGIPATGRTVKISGLTLARVENGKVVEGWNNWDQLGLQQQLQDS